MIALALYRWRYPQDESERSQVFVLVEDRGERLLVSDASLLDWRIVPTHAYPAADLERIEDR